MNNFERREQLKDALLRSRADAKMSQEKLAKKIGVTKKTISNWENGIGCPDYFQLSDWFSALGLELKDYYVDIQPILEVEPTYFYEVPSTNLESHENRKAALLDRLLHYCTFFWGHINEDNET